MEKFRIRRSHLILMMIGMLFLLAAPTHCYGPTVHSCGGDYCYHPYPQGEYSAVEEEEEGVNRVNEETVVPGAHGP